MSDNGSNACLWSIIPCYTQALYAAFEGFICAYGTTMFLRLSTCYTEIKSSSTRFLDCLFLVNKGFYEKDYFSIATKLSILQRASLRENSPIIRAKALRAVGLLNVDWYYNSFLSFIDSCGKRVYLSRRPP